MERPASPSLEDLVTLCLSRVEEQGEGALAALCDEHPEHAQALRRRMALLDDMGLTAREPLTVPERLGRFRLLDVLGVGGMGVVYRAREDDLDREVALKIVRPEQLLFPGARERFQREVETVARLAHPGIVPVYAVGEEEGIPYLVMERIAGCTLAQALERAQGHDPRRLAGADLARFAMPVSGRSSGEGGEGEGAGARRDPDDVPGSYVAGGPAEGRRAHALGDLFGGTWEQTCLRVVAQIADALEHAHRQGVLHRDIKPSNVMITAGASGQGRASRVLLMDFGLATTSATSKITRSGSHLGSMPYMSPEQARGELDALGPRSDVYALGVTLYELLTLRPAFDQATDTELLEHIRQGDRPNPSRLNPDVSWEAETVCLKAMDTDPARRYGSAADLHRDLVAVLEHRPIEARRAGPVLRARRWGQRRPAAAVGLALGTLLVVGGPVLWAVQESRANVKLRAANDEIDQKNVELTAAHGDVSRANLELEGANADLADALALAEERRGLAERQRSRAEANFDRALAAVDRLLAHVGEERLEHVPGMQPLRTELLTDALGFYDELLEQRPGEVGMLRERSRLGRARGDVLALLGHHDDAVDAYLAEIPRLRELLADDPGNHDVRYTLAGCLSQIGQVFLSSARHTASLPYVEEAIPLLEVIRAETPAQWAVTHDLAVNLTNRALIVDDLGRSAEGRDDLVRALALVDALPPDAAEPRDRDALRARILLSLAPIHGRLGDDLASEAAFSECLVAQRALVEAEPENPELRTLLMRVCNNYSLLLERRGEVELRQQLLEQAYAEAQWLLERDPELAGGQQNLAVLATNIGGLHGASGRRVEAQEWMDRSRVLVDGLLAGDPRVDLLAHQGANLANLALLAAKLGDPQRGLELAEASDEFLSRARVILPGNAAIDQHEALRRIALGEAHARLGDHATAVAWQEQVPDLCRYSPGMLVSMAEVLERCSLVAAQDEDLSEGDRAAFAAAYREVVLAVLEAAVDGGLAGSYHLVENDDLQSLRGDERFEALVRRASSPTP